MYKIIQLFIFFRNIRKWKIFIILRPYFLQRLHSFTYFFKIGIIFQSYVLILLVMHCHTNVKKTKSSSILSPNFFIKLYVCHDTAYSSALNAQTFIFVFWFHHSTSEIKKFWIAKIDWFLLFTSSREALLKYFNLICITASEKATT